MKVGHEYLHFYPTSDSTALRRLAAALANPTEPHDPAARCLLELARQTVSQEGAVRLGREPDLTLKDLVKAGLWWGAFGTRGGDRFKSACDYALARLSQATTEPGRQVRKRKALRDDDHVRLDCLVQRALAEWQPVAELAQSQPLWLKINLDVIDQICGREPGLRDNWQKGDDPFSGLRFEHWRALEFALREHDEGHFAFDYELVAAGYPSQRPGEGEVWAHSIARYSDDQRRLSADLVKRGLIRYAHSNLVEVCDSKGLRAHLDEWREERSSVLDQLGRRPRGRLSGLAGSARA